MSVVLLANTNSQEESEDQTSDNELESEERSESGETDTGMARKESVGDEESDSIPHSEEEDAESPNYLSRGPGQQDDIGSLENNRHREDVRDVRMGSPEKLDESRQRPGFPKGDGQSTTPQNAPSLPAIQGAQGGREGEREGGEPGDEASGHGYIVEAGGSAAPPQCRSTKSEHNADLLVTGY